MTNFYSQLKNCICRYIFISHIIIGFTFMLLSLFSSYSVYALPSGNYIECDPIEMNGTYFRETCCSVKTLAYNIDNGTWDPIVSSENTSIGNWTSSSLTGLAIGGHSIMARINDSCGDVTTISSVFTIIPAARNILITNPTLVNYPQCSAINLYGSFERTSCCSYKTIYYSLDASSWTLASSQASTAITGLWTHNNIVSVSGYHSVRAYISDSCGGSILASTVNFSNTSTAPTVEMILPSATSYCRDIPLSGTYYKPSCCTASIMYSLDAANWIFGNI